MKKIKQKTRVVVLAMAAVIVVGILLGSDGETKENTRVVTKTQQDKVRGWRAAQNNSQYMNISRNNNVSEWSESPENRRQDNNCVNEFMNKENLVIDSEYTYIMAGNDRDIINDINKKYNFLSSDKQQNYEDNLYKSLYTPEEIKYLKDTKERLIAEKWRHDQESNAGARERNNPDSGINVLTSYVFPDGTASKERWDRILFLGTISKQDVAIVDAFDEVTKWRLSTLFSRLSDYDKEVMAEKEKINKITLIYLQKVQSIDIDDGKQEITKRLFKKIIPFKVWSGCVNTGIIRATLSEIDWQKKTYNELLIEYEYAKEQQKDTDYHWWALWREGYAGKDGGRMFEAVEEVIRNREIKFQAFTTNQRLMRQAINLLDPNIIYKSPEGIYNEIQEAVNSLAIDDREFEWAEAGMGAGNWQTMDF